MSRLTILLYSNRPGEAAAYAALLQASELEDNLVVCDSSEQVESKISEADIIFGVHLPASAYKNAQRLKWIQSMWAGVEGLVNAEFAQTPIITKPWGVFGSFLSHYVFGNLLAQKINIFQGSQQQKNHEWKPYQIEKITGKTIGIAGIGDIGSELAKVARAFDMRVWGLNRSGNLVSTADRVFKSDQLIEFVAELDVLVLTLPSTQETRGMFNEQVLAHLKSEAWIINVGRGAVIKDEALIDILRTKKIAGAILDVFAEEPLPQDHPYWTLENCIVTPHIGGPSIPGEITACFLENYNRFKNNEPLLGLVDLQRGY